MSEKVTLNQDVFLVPEYSGLHTMVLTGWTLSYTLLTGGVIVFGWLLDKIYGYAASNPNVPPPLHEAIMLLLLPPILAMILGQISTAGILGQFRMIQIARKFEVCDFWNRCACLRRGDPHTWNLRYLWRKMRLLLLYSTFPILGVIWLGVFFSWIIVGIFYHYYSKTGGKISINWTALGLSIGAFLFCLLASWHLWPFGYFRKLRTMAGYASDSDGRGCSLDPLCPLAGPERPTV